MSLLPAPLHLQLPAPHAAPPRMRAHLMPLRIEYDGPAPITRYFLAQPEAASSSSSAANGAAPAADESTAPAARTYEAAFRGRALHGTALELAPLRLFLCDVPASSCAAASAPSSSAPVKRAKAAAAPPAPTPSDEGLRRSPRKRAMPPPPPPPPGKKKGATMQVFSMDSDSDGEPVDEEEQDLGWGDEEVPGASTPPEAPAEEPLAAPPEQREQGRTMRVQATADELLLWAPDGPVDRGDDVYWRTLREWQGVRAGMMQWE